MRDYKLTKRGRILRKLEKSQRKRFGVKERESVLEMNRCGQIERDRRNEKWIAKKVYIDPQ